MTICALLMAACGAPDTKPDAPQLDGARPVKLHSSITSGSYQACGAFGHVRLRFGTNDAFRLLPDPPRTGKTETVTINQRTWTIGQSAWLGDMSQSLTIDGRLRDETPALWAKTTNLWLDATGLDRTQLQRILERIDDPTPDADPQRHHQLGTLHLHLPAAAFFEHVGIGGTDESYGARFARKSQWVELAPEQNFAGAKFWWSATQHGTNDHTGAPFLPAWHGEAAIGALVLEVDAVGNSAVEARFLELARVAIESALVDPTASCRARSGHMGA